MTLAEFQRRLQAINPRLHIRIRGVGDVGGIYLGSEYLIRLTKGELNVNGYRYTYFTDRLQKVEGNIQKRGRKTIVKMLEQRRLIKNFKQRASLLWGMNA